MNSTKQKQFRSKGKHRSASFEHYQSSGIVDDEENGKPMMRGALRRLYCATTPHSQQSNPEAAFLDESMSNNVGCATYAFLPGAEDLEDSFNDDSRFAKLEQ